MSYTKDYISYLEKKYSNEPEFVQAVEEVLGAIADFVDNDRRYQANAILERLTEPDRLISFRVTWEDDQQNINVNKGYRVQFNNALGPYKGGLRFHPSVNQSILKFLGFEQIFKNALTGLPLGGGKGGSDFDPKGKSEAEIRRFAQSFITELTKYIDDDVDVPAGDIGVSSKEIGYMFGQMKKINNRFNGTLTGKGLGWGGSQIRTEATGYGLVYFLQEMMQVNRDQLSAQRILISGAGNVAQYAAQKAIAAGAKVLTMSDSSGTIFAKSGIDNSQLAWIMELKNARHGRIKEAAQEFGFEYLEGQNPWRELEADIALPCATQNEITEADAQALVKNGIQYVAEGANMPSTAKAIEVFVQADVRFGPAKAANAGGVAVSGLEMAQNAGRIYWERDDVDRKLQEIMATIHAQITDYGSDNGKINYIAGANIAAFKKVAEAMMAQGVV